MGNVHEEISDVTDQAAWIVTACFFSGAFVGLFSFIGLMASALAVNVRGGIGCTCGLVVSYLILVVIPQLVRIWERNKKDEIYGRR